MLETLWLYENKWLLLLNERFASSRFIVSKWLILEILDSKRVQMNDSY